MKASNIGNATAIAVGAVCLFVACKNPFYDRVESVVAEGGQERTAGQVAAPTISPSPGTYSSDQSVSIATGTAGAVIYYTRDGSSPGSSSATKYTGPFLVAGSGTHEVIKAVARKSGMDDSAVATADLRINYLQCSAPSFSPTAGSYSADQTVTISCAASGATIHYTTDGSDPTTSSPVYSSGVPVGGNGTNMTIKAMATKAGLNNSAIATAAYVINYSQVSTPNFFPPAGTLAGPTLVTISSATPGASIRYTTDGSTPTSTSGTLYSFPVDVSASMTIKAVAYEAGWLDSISSSAVYVLPVTAPTFSPGGGTYSVPQSVTISTTTPGAAIRYTTDGSDPTSTSGTVYSAPVAVNGSMTLKAIAYLAGWSDSPVFAATYTLPAAAPTFSPGGGTYPSAIFVTISSTTPGVTIRYTTDGSTPTSTVGTVYSSAVVLTDSLTLRAVAYEAGWSDSIVTSATYSLPVAAPSFGLSSGTYNTPQSVTITTTTPGATIRYTTDGSAPSSSVGSVYSAAVPVNASMTLRAIAYEAGWVDSSVSTTTYTLQPFVPLMSPMATDRVYTDLITVSCTTSGASFAYTTDGSMPTASGGSVTHGTLYTVPFSLPRGLVTLKAISFLSGWNSSAVVSVPYTVGGFITTFAGVGGTQGFSGNGGPATSALMKRPFGLAHDAAGNVYVADADNVVVRKIDTSGTITVFAGTGVSGYTGDGGAATSATMTAVYGLAVDPATGSVYISDLGNHVVRKVQGGMITTVAGTGTSGYSGDGGPAPLAQLKSPLDVDYDPSTGSLYILDGLDCRVRKIDAGGVITTVAGSGVNGFSGDGGLATSATFGSPGGIAYDPVTASLYIADTNNQRIRKVQGGVITTVVGTGTAGSAGDGGPAISAQLSYPIGVAVDGAGNLYIADQSNHRIRKVVGGTIYTIAGNLTQGFLGDGGPATAAEMYWPQAVDVDSAGNTVWVADRGNYCVRKIY